MGVIRAEDTAEAISRKYRLPANRLIIIEAALAMEFHQSCVELWGDLRVTSFEDVCFWQPISLPCHRLRNLALIKDFKGSGKSNIQYTFSNCNAVSGDRKCRYPVPFKIPTEHFKPPKITEVFDFVANKMKKSWMKALEVTFADNLSHTCRLLFETCVHWLFYTFGSIYVFL